MNRYIEPSSEDDYMYEPDDWECESCGACAGWCVCGNMDDDEELEF